MTSNCSGRGAACISPRFAADTAASTGGATPFDFAQGRLVRVEVAHASRLRSDERKPEARATLNLVSQEFPGREHLPIRR
jgi:hypothetical protein